MRREDVPAGEAPVIEGDEGDRFYVVLTGTVRGQQAGRPRPARGAAPRRLLRRGGARDAHSAHGHRALTPSVVASCDQLTFDEFIRALFADDEPELGQKMKPR